MDLDFQSTLCEDCGRKIPRQNLALHKLRCQRATDPSDTTDTPPAVASNSSTSLLETSALTPQSQSEPIQPPPSYCETNFSAESCIPSAPALEESAEESVELSSPSLPSRFHPVYAPTSPAEESKGAGGGPEECDDCPVCLSSISEEEAVMRCTGSGGSCHYFHAQCLQDWVDRGSGTCPMCRGPVEIHAGRLSQFLRGEGRGGQAALSLNEPSRGRFKELLANVNSGASGMYQSWSRLAVGERVAQGASILGGAGWGFFNGVSGSSFSSGSYFTDRILWENTSKSTKIAVGVGWIAGLAVRLMRKREKKKDDEKDDK